MNINVDITIINFCNIKILTVIIYLIVSSEAKSIYTLQNIFF